MTAAPASLEATFCSLGRWTLVQFVFAL